jgi:outer membrane immunogenic protein
MRMGNFVVGGLLEASKPQLRDAATAYSTGPAGYHLGRELNYALSARARVGFTPGGGALFYATGGPSYAKIKHDFTTTNTANTFTPTNDGEMTWGWQAGGGAEIMVAGNLSVGLEYLYNRYDDDKYYVAAGAGTAPTNPLAANGGTYLRQDPKFQFHTIRATLGLQF